MPLNVERLMQHLRFLSVDLGPRRPTSAAEHAAASYVRRELSAAGIGVVTVQPFEGSPQLAYKLVPPLIMGAFGLLLTIGRAGRVRRLGGALTAFGAALMIPSAWRLRWMPWEAVLPHRPSQNVIARIKPINAVQRKVVLLASLDTAHHKFSADPRLVDVTPLLAPLTVVGLIGGGVLALLNQFGWLRFLIAQTAMGAALTHTLDDLTGSVAGANDNASGVAVLLTLAENLTAQPLSNTEIWLVFTGCSESGGDGLRTLLDTYAEPLRDGLFIELEAVGTGELCWVTRHGLNPLSAYQSDPLVMQLAEQVAAAHPELGLMGKSMQMVDAVALLADYGLRGLTLTSYDRLSGHTPNRHRFTDTISAIQPATVERAARFTWELLRLHERQ